MTASPSALAGWFSSSKTSDVAALLASVDASTRARVFASVSASAVTASRTLSEDGADDAENAPPAGSPLAIDALRGAAAIVFGALEDGAPAANAEAAALLGACEALHAALLVLPRSGALAALAVPAAADLTRACERAWTASLQGAARVAPLVVLTLLADAASDPSKVTEAILKRLWALRGALAAIDFSDEDSSGLLELLLRAFANGGVLRAETGRRFLASVIGLSPLLAARAHGASRASFPLPSRAAADWLADVYLRAWTGAEPDVRAVIETSALQDFAQRGVHAAEPEVFSSVRDIFATFVRARNTKARKDVDSLLARVYAPILWRALGATNAAVRRNAATLFRDSFPLSASADTAEAACTRSTFAEQVTALTALANDDNAAVRELGVGFVSDALASQWSAFPAPTRDRLVGRVALCAEDAASPGVRAAAIRGLGSILAGAPTSHTLLASSGALAAAARHVHDRTPAVRTAAVDLLVSVDSFRGSFPGGARALVDGSVGGEEALLARLALDAALGSGSARATEGLARILLPTLFPADGTASAKDAAKRIASGLASAEEATLALLRLAHRFPDIAAPGRIAAVVTALVRVAARVLALPASEDAEEDSPLAATTPAAEKDDADDADESGFVRRRNSRTKPRSRRNSKATVAASSALVAAPPKLRSLVLLPAAPAPASRTATRLIRAVGALWESTPRGSPPPGATALSSSDTGAFLGALRGDAEGVVALLALARRVPRARADASVTHHLSSILSGSDGSSEKNSDEASVAMLDCLFAWGGGAPLMLSAVAALEASADEMRAALAGVPIPTTQPRMSCPRAIAVILGGIRAALAAAPSATPIESAVASAVPTDGSSTADFLSRAMTAFVGVFTLTSDALAAPAAAASHASMVAEIAPLAVAAWGAVTSMQIATRTEGVDVAAMNLGDVAMWLDASLLSTIKAVSVVSGSEPANAAVLVAAAVAATANDAAAAGVGLDAAARILILLTTSDGGITLSRLAAPQPSSVLASVALCLARPIFCAAARGALSDEIARDAARSTASALVAAPDATRSSAAAAIAAVTTGKGPAAALVAMVSELTEDDGIRACVADAFKSVGVV